MNLSSKLNTLYLSPNFRLDKHKNRELTIFNMLGSGLFEQFDTLYVEVLGDDGRIRVRESGTEPVIRVMVEADSDEICEKYVDEVIDVITKKGHLA